MRLCPTTHRRTVQIGNGYQLQQPLHCLAAENYNRIYDNPDMALDLYTRQCSLGITAQQLGIAAGTIANNGVNPVTKQTVFEASLAPKSRR